MSRSLFGWVLSAAMVGVPGLALASEAPRVATMRDKDHTTFTLRAGSLQVVQKISRRGVDVTVKEGKDVLHFTGDLDGRVSFARGPVRRAFLISRAGQADQVAVRQLLDSSPALAAFDRVMQSSWGQSHAAAMAFRSPHSLLSTFRGNTASVGRLVAEMAGPQVTMQRVRRDPGTCYSSFWGEVDAAVGDYQSCFEEAQSSWNPLAVAICAYTLDIRGALAVVWLADCLGLTSLL